LQDLSSNSCNVDSVQAANMAQLHPILHDLVDTTFFRLFRVNQKPKCAYWKAAVEEKAEAAPSATCQGGGGDGFRGIKFGKPSPTGFGKSKSLPQSSSQEPEHTACGIETSAEDEPAPSWIEPDKNDINLDRSKTAAEQVASEQRDNETGACEFEEDLPTYWVDMCSADHTKGADVEDINLIKNPERNTGYNGSHIWEAMYNENCFEVGSDLPRGRYGDKQGMCYEERVLYRLLSGWHASTTISICKSYYAPGTRLKGAWAPNVERYMESLGNHPERVKNLHFSFVVMLRAIKKAAPFLHQYQFPEYDGSETNKTRNLIRRLLDSQVLSLCSPLFEAFDETRLFKSSGKGLDVMQERHEAEHRIRLKRQFKSTFKNITELVDCVQCQRCRLHAKIFSLGLGSALKILLTPPELISTTTSRDEVVALVNVLWKLSEAIEDATELQKLYWTQQTEASQKSQRQKPEEESKAPPRPSSPPLPTPSDSTPWQAVPDSRSVDSLMGLLDGAIGAVKRASAAGMLSQADELAVLRSLVVQKPSAEVLLLAKHYAAEKPELFAKLAAEASGEAATSDTFSWATNVASARPMGVVGSAQAPADAIVIGAGLAGMAATVSLLDRGATVVMVDKQPYLGGNSGKASSGINAAMDSSVESLIKDTTKSAADCARPDLIAKLAADSAVAVSWLRDRTGVDLSQKCQLGGHTEERTLRPSNAFVGAELTFAIGQVLEKMAKEKPGQFRLLTKTLWRGLDRASGHSGWKVNVQSTQNSSEEVLEASSVVIASGGFGYDVKEVDSYLMKYRPDLKEFPTTLGAHTTGDGIKIAEKLGAKLVDMDRVQLHPTGFVNPSKPLERVKTLAAELLRGAGGLILDHSGSRFTDELGTRKAVTEAMLSQAKKQSGPNASHFSLVLNKKAASNKADRHVTLYSKKGLLTKVVGLEGLAAHLGVKRETIQVSFEAYNEGAKAGKGPFGRTLFPANSWPIEWDEDFYVGSVTPVIHYTMGGISINTDGVVVSKANETFPGLYAIGEASGGVHGDNRLAGNSLLECTVFGRHVGLTLPMRQAPVAEAPAAAAPQVAAAAAPHAPAPVVPALAPAAPQAAAKQNKITLEGMAAMKKDGKTVVALYGKVYDLTEYVEEHPGGAEAIIDVSGADGTETFETVHNKQLLDSMGFEPIGDFAS
jgi:flavocytochrome c